MRKNDLAFFNFTHLQNIINKREQIIRCYLHLFMIFLYQHLIIKMILIHLYQTNHTIQRCPDIMTHAAEKIRFCSALGPHFIECRLKTCLFLLIPFMFLCSILQQNDCIDHRYLSKHFCIKHYHPGHKNCFLYPADTSILFTDTIFHRYMCFSIFKSLTQSFTIICHTITGNCFLGDFFLIFPAIILIGTWKRVIHKKFPAILFFSIQYNLSLQNILRQIHGIDHI